MRERLSGVVEVNWKKVRKQQRKGRLRITRGVVMYPRFYYFNVGENNRSGSLSYKDYSRLVFTGINRQTNGKIFTRQYMLPQQIMIDNFPQDSTFRAISCKTGKKYDDVLAISIETPDGEIYNYVRDPLPAFSCPVPEPVCDSIDNCR